jgi:predicted MFS family arabinose efflux permease
LESVSVTDRSAEGRRAAAALLLLSVSVVLGLSVWFAASAAAPHLQLEWGLDARQAGWLTSLVQLGFVAGTLTAALLNLADIVPSHRYFAVSTATAALANAALLVVPDYAGALLSRFGTGFFLAGVYPPAMKMAATWYRDSRGLAIGIVVGALTLGKSTPYLVDAFGGASMEWIVLST